MEINLDDKFAIGFGFEGGNKFFIEDFESKNWDTRAIEFTPDEFEALIKDMQTLYYSYTKCN